MNELVGLLEGGCTCGQLRYCLRSGPLFVHCCHCTWCQRETGAAFAVNALIEADHVEVLRGSFELVDTPTVSGAGQRFARCGVCRVAVWSHYDFAGVGKHVRFVRVGTLDDAGAVPPDIHIYTSSKLPWVELPAGALAVPEYYRRREVWPAESLVRLDTLRAAVDG